MTEELEHPVKESMASASPPVDETQAEATDQEKSVALETFEESEAGPFREYDPVGDEAADRGEEVVLSEVEDAVEEIDGDADDVTTALDEDDLAHHDEGDDLVEATNETEADVSESVPENDGDDDAYDSAQSDPDDEEDSEDSAELEPVESLGREDTLEAIHALLFASDRPVNAEKLAQALGDIDRDVVVTLMDELRHRLEQMPVPYVLREIAGGYQLTTKPQFGPYIRRLFEIKKSNRLTKSVLETLAIIAYKQPVTRPSVEAIRGVSVSHAFEILQEKRLIKVSGVAEVAGRPKLYRTTDEFLMHFGIESLKELPSIEEIREMGY